MQASRPVLTVLGKNIPKALDKTRVRDLLSLLNVSSPAPTIYIFSQPRKLISHANRASFLLPADVLDPIGRKRGRRAAVAPAMTLYEIETMEPRVADKRDVPRITEVLLAALPQDPFYQYLWQHRKAFPNDHKFYWEHRMQCDIFNPRYAFMVLELKSQRADKTCEWVSAQGTPIISFAIFERMGYSNKALEWEYRRMTGPKGVNHVEANINDDHLRRDFPEGRRDATKERMKACETSLQEANNDFSAILSRDRLQIELICTYPCYQRRGAASTLVQWSVREAIKEQVNFVSAAASLCGEGLYKKNNFEYLEGEKKEREVVDGGESTFYAVMFFEVS